MASAFKLRNLIKKENVKLKCCDLFICPTPCFWMNLCARVIPSSPVPVPPRVHLLYTKAYLPSSDASLKSHLFCSRALERDEISKACESQRK